VRMIPRRNRPVALQVMEARGYRGQLSFEWPAVLAERERCRSEATPEPYGRCTLPTTASSRALSRPGPLPSVHQEDEGGYGFRNPLLSLWTRPGSNRDLLNGATTNRRSPRTGRLTLHSEDVNSRLAGTEQLKPTWRWHSYANALVCSSTIRGYPPRLQFVEASTRPGNCEWDHQRASGHWADAHHDR